MAELNSNFIEELFKASITNKNTMDILSKHLEYQHLPTEPYKAIWKEIITFYELEGKLPSIGILNQAVEGIKEKEVKLDSKHILASIKKLRIDNVHEELIQGFETYKKQVEFVQLYRKVSEMYSVSESKAIKYMAEKSHSISTFSIKDGFYDRVFADFEKRQSIRKLKDPDSYDERIPSLIHELDYYIRGGWKKGSSFLVLGRSGTGKSTFLRWCAISAARMGKRVVLFSLEGTRDDTLETLDSAWTSTPLEDIEFGKMQTSKIKEISKAMNAILLQGGEIYVHSSESFDSMTLDDTRATMHEIEKIYGKIDMALFDYLELFQVDRYGGLSKDGAGERRRREVIANKMTDLAIEFRCVTGTATQANDIPPSMYNDPEFVMTRTHISEFKGVVKPFSYFLTINQSDDEANQNIVRLFCDKFRKHRSGQTIISYQRMDIGRFYDSKKTLDYLWDKDIKRKK